MNALMQSISSLIKENQVIAGMVGLYGAGIITYLLRNIPTAIWSFVRRNMTTSLVITSQNLVYYDFMRWAASQFKNKKYRTIKVGNGRYGDDKEFIKSIGYGLHWLLYQGNLLQVSLIKESANNTVNDKEVISITKIGRGHGLFNRMLKELKIPINMGEKIKVYRYEGRWALIKEQYKRSLDSIFMGKNKINDLTTRINRFISQEDWYVEHGIPYQLGILLYGEPGTGKSSLVRAIASYLKYDIYYLDTVNMSRTEEAMSRLPDRSIMVIEDIDSSSVTHKRSNNKSDPVTSYGPPEEESRDILEMLTSSTLSTILNALDGIFSAHGRILIATTNHIDKLDPALIRPGRIDVKLEIGYIDNTSLYQFMEVYYPNECSLALNVDMKTGHTIAELQEMLVQGATAKEVVTLCEKDREER